MVVYALVVECFELLSLRGDVKAFFHPCARGQTHRVPKPLMVEKFSNCQRKRRHVSFRAEQAGLPMAHNFRYRRVRETDHRRSERLSFCEHHSESFHIP
jgi:hypothetical protein